MDQQLTFFQSPEPLDEKYKLFLGVFPDAEAADLICKQRATLRGTLGLRGIPRPRNHLHVTVHCIGDYFEVPERDIVAATKVCTSALASQPSFEVTFDHAMSFRRRSGDLPFVLVNPNGNSALLELHRLLVIDLAKHRLAGLRDLKIVPHITMLYDRLNVPMQPVCPVRWRVKEVVLVLSHLGATKYERLACWKLSA
jgi:2'-5' RNA ligase